MKYLRKTTCMILALAGLALLEPPGFANAAETRVAGEDHVPPPATLDELGWLVGQWVGKGIDDAEVVESWLPPSRGAMVGTFVQETPDGAIMFTEHMYVVELDGSLEVRLKHFNADLTGWEDKDGMVRFPLIALEECAAYFRALTYRCDGEGGMLVAVRMKSDKPEPQELVFRFRRMDNDGRVKSTARPVE